MVIGLNLAPTAIESASQNWPIALIVLATVAIVNLYVKGFLRLLPVIAGIVKVHTLSHHRYVDPTPVAQAAWIGVPRFTLPVFDAAAIGIIAPAALPVWWSM